MTLEEEVEEMLRRATAAHPAIQRAWKAGGMEGQTEASREEAFTALIDTVNGLREVVRRLAREIDELRSS